MPHTRTFFSPYPQPAPKLSSRLEPGRNPNAKRMRFLFFYMLHKFDVYLSNFYHMTQTVLGIKYTVVKITKLYLKSRRIKEN